MPELPEVETVRRGLTQLIVPSTITGVEVFWDKIITPPFSSQKFCDNLYGETIHAIERRGKYLIFLMDHWAMISHLRMEGKYKVCSSDQELEKHTHVIFHLHDGRDLRYLDVRKFGRMTLVPVAMAKDAIQALNLGPEPLPQCFQVEEFSEQLKKRHRAIKPTLLDQSLVAGLGNIYADEVLFRSKIHPLRKANSLSEAEVQVLHDQIITVLGDAVEAGGSTIRTYKNTLGEEGTFQQSLLVYGQTDQLCVVCGTPIQKIKVAQRGTHFCPTCQVL